MSCDAARAPATYAMRTIAARSMDSATARRTSALSRGRALAEMPRYADSNGGRESEARFGSERSARTLAAERSGARSTVAFFSAPTRASSIPATRNSSDPANGRRFPVASNPQYDWYFVSVMRSPGFHAPVMIWNGPVPAAHRDAGENQEGPCLRQAGDTMPKDG